MRAERACAAEVRRTLAVREAVARPARDPHAPTTITPLAVSLGLL
ncbi:hypothetical protein [Micromonospora sp. HM134]|nr:hypothetical protein [Micromonospora sp. HM134]